MTMEDIIGVSRSVLETTPKRWLDLTQNLPGDLLRRPPAADEWSALECLQHLVDAERHVFPDRIRYLLEGQDFPAYDPDSQGSKPGLETDPTGLAWEFSRLREEGLVTLARVSTADLDRRARHAELGPVTLSELIHEWAGHDLMHTVQAERALMQPFIAGSGPWQVYFTDHIVAG